MYEEFLSKVSILGQSLLPAASLQPPVSACNQLTSPSPCLLPLLGFLSIQGLLDLFRGTLDCQANRGPEAVTDPSFVRPTPLMTSFSRL